MDKPKFGIGTKSLRNMTESDETIKMIKAYKKYMMDAMKLIGGNEVDDKSLALDIEDIVKFESELAKLTREREEMGNKIEVYNEIPIWTLQNIYNYVKFN